MSASNFPRKASNPRNLFDNPEDANRKSIDIVLDFVKHQITLSALLISLSVAFTNGQNSLSGQDSFSIWLKLAVGCFMLSFVSGFFLMSFISYGVSRNYTYVMEQAKVRFLGTFQGFAFVSGVVFLAVSIFFLASQFKG